MRRSRGDADLTVSEAITDDHGMLAIISIRVATYNFVKSNRLLPTRAIRSSCQLWECAWPGDQSLLTGNP